MFNPVSSHTSLFAQCLVFSLCFLVPFGGPHKLPLDCIKRTLSDLGSYMNIPALRLLVKE